MTELKQIANGNQVLFPFEYENQIYYVRFIRRGTLIHCTGVYLLASTGGRIVPEFWYQPKHLVKTKKVIEEARKVFK